MDGKRQDTENRADKVFTLAILSGASAEFDEKWPGIMLTRRNYSLGSGQGSVALLPRGRGRRRGRVGDSGGQTAICVRISPMTSSCGVVSSPGLPRVAGDAPRARREQGEREGFDSLSPQYATQLTDYRLPHAPKAPRPPCTIARYCTLAPPERRCLRTARCSLAANESVG